MKFFKMSCFLFSLSLKCLIPTFAHAESCQVEKVIGARVQTGTYKVNVTREEQDMYEVTGQDIYIKTRYCYQYCYYKDVILEITSASGSYINGELHFLD